MLNVRVDANMRNYIYDIETYPTVFTMSVVHVATGERWRFEISYRRDDTDALVTFIMALKAANARMVGYNNIGFDYPVIHDLVMYRLDVNGIYEKAMSIIQSNDRFGHIIWDKDRLVEQIDLYKIHHFDNKARSTSLKMLEFNMRSPNIEDLPFPVGTLLTPEQIDVLITYNDHDVDETLKFYHHSADMIRFREELSEKYHRNFMNHNDTKIGKDYFIMELEKAGIECYTRDNTGRRVPKQSRRSQIALKDVISPNVQFYHPALQRIRDWMYNQVLDATELKPDVVSTKGVFKDITASLDGFNIDFGMGGAHGSISSTTVHSDDEWVIIDKDVTSYYPSLFIANGFYPEHLGREFISIYASLKEQRVGYAKGTTENAMLKLALNGSFGDTGNEYSPFFDKLCMMQITINGQLQIAMLAEQLAAVPELQLIQVNTDGLTIRVKRNLVDKVENICDMWQAFTGLELEEARYSRMFIRDVNNYIAESDKLKRKGAYEYEMDWHQNHSSLVIPKAAEAALVHGQDIGDFIRNHDDIYDFMLRTKAPRSSKLMWGDKQVQNITRYYISTDGDALVKVSPPPEGYEVGQYKRKNSISDDLYWRVLAESMGFWNEQIHTKNKGKYEERKLGINVGWLTTPCNDITEASWDNINYDYYIQETEKLVGVLR